MGGIDFIIEKARRSRPKKKIVLPEVNDERVIEAAQEIKRQGIAELLFVGEAGNISELNTLGKVIAPAADSDAERIAEAFYESRKHKGMAPDEAKSIICKNPLYYAAMMVRLGMADGFVAGASNTTRDVIRAAMHSIGIDRSTGIVFGVFVIEVDRTVYGSEGLFIFADCAVIPLPTPKQLARIAISSSDLLNRLYGIEPKVAFLTYSSKGSAEGESIDRARKAVALVKEKRPGLAVDGELQLDAAIIPDIQRRKAPDSPLAGRANVLIFPSLDAGNITYKAVEKLGGARAVGPTIMGLKKPCSDLSRGCRTEDIIATIALTVVRS